MHAHRAPRRTEHHLSPFGSRFVRMCPARIGGHTRPHGKRCIRHRANHRLIWIGSLYLRQGKPRDDREDKCAPLEVRRRLPHGGCSRRGLDGENEQINTGQKGFCPYLRTYTVFAHEFIAAHCLVLRYRDVGRRHRTRMEQPCDQSLCHCTSADNANLNSPLHGCHRLGKGISSPRRCPSSE